MTTHPRPDPNLRRRRPALRGALFALLMLGGGGASAAEFCVNGNVAFFGAMQQFEDGDEDTTIRLVQGNYAFPLSTQNDGARLVIAGGYTDTSCTTRSYDPSLTVLRPPIGGGNPIVQVGELEIASVTFRDFEGALAFIAEGDAFGNNVLRMTRTRVEGPLSLGLSLEADEVYVNEAIVTGSGSGDAFTGKCALNIDGPNDGNDVVAIQHTTVTGNPGSGVCIGDHFANSDESFGVWLDNNIFYGNAMSLELSETSEYVIRNNILDGFLAEFGAADPGASSNNIPDDPRFVDAAGGDFHLDNGSPAINSGGTTTFMGVPQYDITGGPRLVGPRPDMGPHESGDDGSGDVLTVTNTFDSNTPGTLRWALNQANANPNLSIILFDIPGACPRIISPGSELPPILTRVAILGYSQPGSQSNSGGVTVGGGTDATLCIHLAGGTSRDYGLRIPVAAGSNGWLNVSGVTFSGFQQAAVALEAGIGSIVTGNHIVGGRFVGILVAGSAEDSQIGGPDPWQRNLIQGSAYGVALNPFGDGNKVENNLIGLAADGNSVTATSGNDVGIGISGNGNYVRGNAVAGNGGGVVIVDGDRNYVSGNTFGMKVGFRGLCGLPPMPPCPPRDLFNDSHGVLIQGNASDNGIWSNTIANSGGAGIRVTDGGQRNSFLANRIWNSGEFGIDLNGLGRQIPNNDTDPSELASANRGLNVPTIAAVGGGHRSGTASGSLATINGTYLIEAFASDRCDGSRGQARWPLGSTNVTIGNATPSQNGSVPYQIALRAPGGVSSLDGYFVTVTATDSQGSIGVGNTSELSGCSRYEFSDLIFADGFD